MRTLHSVQVSSALTDMVIPYCVTSTSSTSFDGFTVTSDQGRGGLYYTKAGETKCHITVGMKRGDEGKGAVESREVQLILDRGETVGAAWKGNGGANSGHTVFFKGVKYVLNILPSISAIPEVKRILIGGEVFADAEKLHREIQVLEQQGITVHNRLGIDIGAVLQTPIHRLRDVVDEIRDGRGTTQTGMTPTASEYARKDHWRWEYFTTRSKQQFRQWVQSRVDEFADHVRGLKITEEQWLGCFDSATAREQKANRMLIDASVAEASEFDFSQYRAVDGMTLNVDAIVERYWSLGMKFAQDGRIRPIGEDIREALDAGEHVCCENGQAHFLDPMFGFPPNTTVTHTTRHQSERASGAGLLDSHVIAVTKAIETSVGTHDTVTRIADDHPLNENLSDERGAVTGRRRALLWPNAAETAECYSRQGFHSWIINKLDPLALTPEQVAAGHKLKICIGFKDADGSTSYAIPHDTQAFAKLQAVYVELEPWTEDISKMRSYEELPVQTRLFVAAHCYYFALAFHKGDKAKIDLHAMPSLRALGVGPGERDAIFDLPSFAQMFWMYEDHLNKSTV